MDLSRRIPFCAPNKNQSAQIAKEKIDEMLKSKKELADLAVYEGEKIITELSDEEIYEIFSLAAL